MKKLFSYPTLLLLLFIASWQHLSAQDRKVARLQEENKKLMAKIVDGLFNKGDTSVADAYFVAAFAEEEKKFTTLIRNAFPDLAITLDIVVAEGNLVAARWTAKGTHQGKFLGIEPTQKFVLWKGSWFWTFEKGKVTDGMGQGSWDALGLMKQLQQK